MLGTYTNSAWAYSFANIRFFGNTEKNICIRTQKNSFPKAENTKKTSVFAKKYHTDFQQEEHIIFFLSSSMLGDGEEDPRGGRGEGGLYRGTERASLAEWILFCTFAARKCHS